MKVAFTSAFRSLVAVHAFLQDCDYIYTTQVRHRDELYALYGEDRVFFIPDSTEGLIAYLKSTFTNVCDDEEVEFFTWSDAWAIYTKLLGQGDEQTILVYHKNLGYKLEEVDSETVRWYGQGNEYTAAPGRVPQELIDSCIKEYGKRNNAKTTTQN